MHTGKLFSKQSLKYLTQMLILAMFCIFLPVRTLCPFEPNRTPPCLFLMIIHRLRSIFIMLLMDLSMKAIRCMNALPPQTLLLSKMILPI